jgi:hypothetical protein
MGTELDDADISLLNMVEPEDEVTSSNECVSSTNPLMSPLPSTNEIHQMTISILKSFWFQYKEHKNK